MKNGPKGIKSKVSKWFKRTFAAKRIYLSIRFSVIVGVTYWATKVYENAFETGISYIPVLAFIFVALVLTIFGGDILELLLHNPKK